MDTTTDQHPNIRYHRRDFAIGTLSQTSTIIVIVCAGIVGILLVLIFFRLLSRSSARSRSAPLPPRQELAHHREHQLAQITEDRLPRKHTQPNTWLHADPSIASSSTASLLPPVHSVGTSFTASSEQDSASLNPPPSAFHSRPGSSTLSSLGSYSADASPIPPSRISSSLASSSLDASRARRISRVSAPALSSSHTSHRFSTHRSPSSRINGMPHGSNSGVQIVLPTPLAPQLYQHMVGAEDSWGRRILQGEESLSSVSMSDAWVGVTAGISTTARQSPQQRSPSDKRRRAASFDQGHPLRIRSAVPLSLREQRVPLLQSCPCLPLLHTGSITHRGRFISYGV
ncbi:hypothetical protein K488DRAFT_81888 [Vararia minispora EC-137]|uniref:Uncharacterized protein n=1 Tax=Vararia minispora EC-137 TaxID=1314806 RepID=A0ACB8QZF3_9AGAM|nr:hypothetical protein K488DRAFT_81888 [Vararia minispora EC-137]